MIDWKFWFDVILGWVICIIVLAIGLVPYFLFQILGWTDPSLELLSRVIGFFMILFGWLYYMHKKESK